MECLMNLQRQLDLVHNETLNRKPVHLIGAGGIGSAAAIGMVKMGLTNFRVHDNDILEDHNFPNQFYFIKDLGLPKVEALNNVVQAFTGTDIQTSNEKITTLLVKQLQGYVISGVDSIPSRLDIWNGIKYNMNIPFYIDGRMSAETMELFIVKPFLPSDIKWYEERTPEDTGENYDVEPCTSRAIIYNTMVIGGIIASLLKKIVNGEQHSRYYLFDLVTMTLIEEE